VSVRPRRALAGLLAGAAYGVSPLTWTVPITSRTAKGTYTFFDAARPWDNGVVRWADR
jgi:hypothetical protein